MKTTVIITVKAKNGHCMSDIREVSASDLIDVINAYISNGAELIALEELDETVEEFYSKRMSDDDLDAMAEALEIPE